MTMKLKVVACSLAALGVYIAHGSQDAKEEAAKALKADLSRASDIGPDSFEAKCRRGDKQLCLEKFVVWEGTVNQGAKKGSGELDIDTVDGHGVLNLVSKTTEDLMAGQKILFHARISELNLFSANVYKDGYIRKVTLSAAGLETSKQAEAEAKREQERAKLIGEARDMGVSPEQYKIGEEHEGSAHTSCQLAVQRSARWEGASTNWVPNYGWRIDGTKITIGGHDVSLKNGYGGSRTVDYNCVFDISTGTATILGVD